MLNSVGAAGKVFEYLDREPQVSTMGKLQPETLTGHVQFNNLCFSYPTRQERKVLQVKLAWEEVKHTFYHHHIFAFPCAIAEVVCHLLVLGLLSGAEAGSADCSGGAVRGGEEHLCQSAGEVLPASAGRDPIGWTATAELPAPLPTQEGNVDSYQNHY